MSGTAGTAGSESTAGTTAGAVGTENGIPGLPGIAVPGEGGISTGHESAGIDYDRIAREKGWRPKDEFDGDPDTWVGPEEFVKRQPLFDKIKTQNKQLKELSKTVDALAKHFNVSVAQQRENMLRELKAERRELIEEGEVAKVEAIDAKIDEIKALPTPDVKPVGNPVLEKFVEDNSEWWNKDKQMTRFAVMFNESYLAENPNDLEKSLEETLKAVKNAFPDKFKNQRRENPPAVDTGGAPQGGGSKYSLNRLTKEQKIVYDQLVTRHKQMTHDEYFKQLDEVGYLEK